MDALFIDSNGNKKNFLYQYDVGQSFIIENFEYSKAPKVQFSIKSIKTSPSVGSRLENGTLTVAIPDMLLTYGEDIIAYLYIQDATKGTVIETVFISVIPRKQPAEYQYTSENFARTINGTTISEDSRFGEVAVWADENPNKEKRYGYFVTASYGSNSIVISKASSVNNVYGVTVNDVGFAANCTNGKLDALGNLLSKYAYVCTSGFAEVMDNGRCSVGGMCIPDTDGTARTPTNKNGYKVIARTDVNHIIIFVDITMQTIDGLQTGINNLNSNLTAHKNDKENPHEVTKAQVGLGLVPNVTTNDQTPTYTESSTLEPLTSGEKLSIAFGKIMKAINDLIEHKNNKTNPHTIDYTKADTLEEISSTEILSTTFGKLSKAVADLIEHKGNTSNPHSVTKAQVGLGNCDNTSDIDKPVSTAQKTAIDAVQTNLTTHENDTTNPHVVTKAQVGLGNCDDTSDVDKPVSTAQQTAINTVQSNLDTHKNDKTNPHEVTKAQVGLGNADNTSDIDKPVSTAQAAEIARVEGLANDAQSDIDAHAARTDNPHSVTKAQVGLGNADNTADIDKPISTAQSNEFKRLEGLITTAQGDTDGHSIRTDNPHNVTAEQVGLGNCDNTSDADKPISTATQTALDKKADLGEDGLVLSSQLPSTIGWGNVTDKPTEFTPSAHASTHYSGGSDPITPSSIGAKSVDESDVFVATYGTTTSVEIEEAYQAGKAVFCCVSGGITYPFIPMSVRWSATEHEFGYGGNASFTTYSCKNDTWSISSSDYYPKIHASTHASGGSDPITPDAIGAATQSDFDTLQDKVNNLSITDFILTDATTGTQYTIGVDNGAIVLNEV